MFLKIKKFLRLFPPFSSYVLIRKLDRMRPTLERLVEDFSKIDEMNRIRTSLQDFSSLLVNTYVALGRTTARHSPREAIDCFQRVLSFDPDAPQARRYLSEVYVQIGDMQNALNAICQALRISPVRAVQEPSEASRLPAGTRPAKIYEPHARITIATSLMPRRISEQKAAVRSWRRLGIDVISVNNAHEIAILKPEFPEVTFKEAAWTAEAQCGKPVVPTDEIIRFLSESDSPIVGIFNSDIVIEEGDGFLDAIRRQVPGSLVLSNRIDVDNAGSADGRLYAGGYDLFFFERSACAIFASSGMIMGMPWWDFWMPLAAHLGSLKLKKLTSTRALHYTHPIGYSFELFMSLSVPFSDSLASIARAYPLMPGSELATLTRGLFEAIDASVAASGQALEPYEVGTLCSFVNFLIDHMSTSIRGDGGSQTVVGDEEVLESI
ncbi:MAG TPA: hypothetical protein VNT30_08290 [Stellaceae bacterium]|nr:hypothetical protein [Stellaceae bacterium]